MVLYRLYRCPIQIVLAIPFMHRAGSVRDRSAHDPTRTLTLSAHDGHAVRLVRRRAVHVLPVLVVLLRPRDARRQMGDGEGAERSAVADGRRDRADRARHAPWRCLSSGRIID